MFWTVSIGLLLLTGFVTLWPLLTRGSGFKPLAAFLIVLLPVAGYFLYQHVGEPQALELPTTQMAAAPDGDINTLTEQLRTRLEENPDNVEGWVLLGRSYKTLQQYPQALEALENAYRLAPDEPLVLVELVEAQLFASGNPQITPAMIQALEQAVSTDPSLQKGLWLLGIASAQAGEDVRAIDWWSRLLTQLEPSSNIALSVYEQIEQARLRLGNPAVPIGENQSGDTPASAWEGLNVRVEFPESDSSGGITLPADAALYVIARAQGVSGGPPLGVSRIAQPVFPVEVKLTDANSMMPQRPLSGSPTLVLQARLSMNGQPIAAAGDLQSEPFPVEVGQSDETVTLVLVQSSD